MYPDTAGPHSDRLGDDLERFIPRISYATYRTAASLHLWGGVTLVREGEARNQEEGAGIRVPGGDQR
jgi:hypothetical protein